MYNNIVRSLANTYHIIFPEIALLSTVETSQMILLLPVYHYQSKKSII
jgi:hypothetical protein